MALVKFKKLCGADWRNSKYVYVISSLETSLFDTNIILRDLLDAADMVHKCICVILGNQADFCPGDTVLLDNQRNYNCLPEAGHGENVSYKYIKQRTDKWFNIRKEAKVTGSTIYGSLGLESLKKQVQHFDQVINKKEAPEPDQDTNKRMQHGRENEIHALGTHSSSTFSRSTLCRRRMCMSYSG